MASTSCFLHHHALSNPTATRSSSQRHVSINKPTQMVCRAQNQPIQDEDDNAAVPRRLGLTVLICAAAVGTKVSPADATYGEAANVFGKPKTDTDFLPYNGDGFKVLVKWNPSNEKEYPGQVLRYKDNFDAKINLSVMVFNLTDKKSITDFGPPEEFLPKTVWRFSWAWRYSNENCVANMSLADKDPLRPGGIFAGETSLLRQNCF